MALSIHYIMRLVPRTRKADSAYVKVMKPKYGYTKQGWGFIAAQTYSTHVRQGGWIVPNPSPQRYVTVITILNKKMHATVSCSCPDFCFRWEVALTSKGSAIIEYSNGEFPEVTNPTLKIGDCKHTYALYEIVRHKLIAQ